ncbi:hypothetical protein [Rhizobium sp. CECT 9324]|uniref:hypothetical protein n=1 Tax=Rhizobium sp. CECT 9324 TaxID=2845820 RepID=UPI000DDD4E71|nr:hypothetical protein [Rhizobium sp. CECT 9324]
MLSVTMAVLAMPAVAFSENADRVQTFGDAEAGYVVALLEKKQCDAAWDILWKHALGGSSDAAAMIIDEAAFGRILPPFAPLTGPEGEMDPRWVKYLGFLTDLAFSVRIEISSADEVYTKASMDMKRQFLKEAWSKSDFERYENAGCLDTQHVASCTDPGAWPSMARSLSYWNEQLNQHRAPRAMAECKDAWHSWLDQQTLDSAPLR